MKKFTFRYEEETEKKMEELKQDEKRKERAGVYWGVFSTNKLIKNLVDEAHALANKPKKTKRISE